MKSGSITPEQHEIETLKIMVAISLQRLYDLGEIKTQDLQSYVNENVKLNVSPLTVLKQISLNHLLSVFHNNGPCIKILCHADEVSKDVMFDISKDEFVHIVHVEDVALERTFDLVVYNRHGNIGIETEFDSGPALVEDMIISIWDNLTERVNCTDMLNHGLDNAGINKFFEIPIDEFIELYLEHIKI